MEDNITYVDENNVKCEGEAEKIGHPLVYLTIKEREIACPYCSHKFVLK